VKGGKMIELSTELIESAKTDQTDFTRLYNHYSPFVWRVAYRTANGNSDLATHIVQSVFITVHRKLKRFRSGSAFSTWLYKITWREAITQVKRERKNSLRLVELSGDEPSQDEYSFSDQEIERILSSLSPKERFLLVSREIEGISFDELAEITGKKSGALRVKVNRIKTKLREELQDER